MPQSGPLRCRLAVAFLIAVWVAAVGGGFTLLDRFETAPGEAPVPPPTWPTASSIRPAEGVPELLLFAHPKCPCTRATISELAVIVARCHGKVGVRVLFYTPRGSAPGWEQTGAWNAAAGIPGVEVTADLDGEEANRFSARTSGQVLLYGPGGDLLFSGGITASRGHEGGNDGRDSVVALVTAGTPSAPRTPVFGCPLCGGKPLNR